MRGVSRVFTGITWLLGARFDEWGNYYVRCSYRVRQVIQDMVASYMKAHSVKLDMLQKQIEIQHDAMMKTIDAFRAEMRSEFAALRANNQMEVFCPMTPISERVSVVEARTR